MTFYNHKLYIFGGIHDITWELDDLIVYNLEVHLPNLETKMAYPRTRFPSESIEKGKSQCIQVKIAEEIPT